MRAVIGAVSAVAMLVAQIQPMPAFAQTTAALQVPQTIVKKSAIVEAFAQFPKGGELLAKSIADIIVANPNHASYLVKYVKTAQGLSYAQKVAAEHGLAMALERLGVKAADMPVKAPPPQAQPEVFDYSWLGLALLALVGIGVCVALCFEDDDEPPPVSPSGGPHPKLPNFNFLHSAR
jgi:hypothetical protein